MLPFFTPTKILDSLILMQIVLKGPLHGYALSTLIEKNFGWKPSQTAIYNSLKAMEAAKLISSEERIEKGRVQILYSITKKGQQVFKERQQLFRKNMQKGFSRYLAFVQMFSEIEHQKNSEKLRSTLRTLMHEFKRVSQLTFMLARKDPEETTAIINGALQSLEELAKKHQITLPPEEEEEEGPPSCF